MCVALTLRCNRLTANLTFSLMGSTRGPRAVTLDVSARPATLIRSLLSFTPLQCEVTLAMRPLNSQKRMHGHLFNVVTDLPRASRSRWLGASASWCLMKQDHALLHSGLILCLCRCVCTAAGSRLPAMQCHPAAFASAKHIERMPVYKAPASSAHLKPASSSTDVTQLYASSCPPKCLRKHSCSRYLHTDAAPSTPGHAQARAPQ